MAIPFAATPAAISGAKPCHLSPDVIPNEALVLRSEWVCGVTDLLFPPLAAPLTRPLGNGPVSDLPGLRPTPRPQWLLLFAVVSCYQMYDSGAFNLLLMAVVVAAFLVLVPTVLVLLGRKLVTRRPLGRHARGWLLSLLIAPLVISAFVGSYIYAASKGIDEHTIVKWMNIILTAAFVFGYAIKEFWRFRKRWTFWLELGLLVVVHFIVLQRLHWETASYFWLMLVIGIPELAAVFFLMFLMFDPNAGPPSEDFPK